MQPFVACIMTKQKRYPHNTCMRTGRTEFKSSITTKFMLPKPTLSFKRNSEKIHFSTHHLLFYGFFVCRLNVGNKNSKTKSKEENSCNYMLLCLSNIFLSLKNIYFYCTDLLKN